jgi:hypothetical protein
MMMVALKCATSKDVPTYQGNLAMNFWYALKNNAMMMMEAY